MMGKPLWMKMSRMACSFHRLIRGASLMKQSSGILKKLYAGQWNVARHLRPGKFSLKNLSKQYMSICLAKSGTGQAVSGKQIKILVLTNTRSVLNCEYYWTIVNIGWNTIHFLKTRSQFVSNTALFPSIVLQMETEDIRD